MKYLQSQLVQGRTLDVSDVSNVDDGLTNFIMFDCAKLIKTGLDELKALENRLKYSTSLLKYSFMMRYVTVILTSSKLLFTQSYLGW